MQRHDILVAKPWALKDLFLENLVFSEGYNVQGEIVFLQGVGYHQITIIERATGSLFIKYVLNTSKLLPVHKVTSVCKTSIYGKVRPTWITLNMDCVISQYFQKI